MSGRESPNPRLARDRGNLSRIDSMDYRMLMEDYSTLP
jgi:hypothetical protein